jgi:uncharacterized protein YsxB (DUF464 family)
MKTKNIILAGSAWLIAVSLLASSFTFADSATKSSTTNWIKKTTTEQKAGKHNKGGKEFSWNGQMNSTFVKSLPTATQEKLKTLQETQRTEMKAIMDSYKDVTRTDAINIEIKAKIEALQTKHKADLMTLLSGITGAEDFIAQMGHGPRGMGEWHFGEKEISWKWQMNSTFVKSLPTATQEKLKTLQETQRTEMKAIMDSYKDVTKTDAVNAEIKAKIETLQTKHKAQLTTLLSGVTGAENFIAQMGQGPRWMGDERGQKELPAFVKSLPTATQEKLKTLQETQRTEMKAIMDSYKDVTKTDAVNAEIKAKIEALQTKHKAQLTTLLSGITGAEDFIAQMGQGPRWMGEWHFGGMGKMRWNK